ncbi:helicase-related protein, partial [bacterium]|nr:helicase-related protein [bacterium]
SKKQSKTGAGSDIQKIIKMVTTKNYDPCIVFAFSKNECEQLVEDCEGIDLNNEDEKVMVDTIYGNALDDLSDDDKRLPQVVNLLPTMRRGIGTHHAGLLPRLKEIVEILFQEGLVKVLVATETMSTGLNMPAKTVVFTSPRKFDGDGYRWISSGEYVQMSGRAGRRGLDDRGLVILMIDERMDPKVARDMLHGRSDPLDSAFRLTYGMITNLTRLEGHDAETLTKKSFAQFQSERKLPALKQKVELLTQEKDGIIIPNQKEITDYVAITDTLMTLKAELRQIQNQPQHAAPFLSPGRLVKICVEDPNAMTKSAMASGLDGGKAFNYAADVESQWGVIVSHDRKPGEGNVYELEVLAMTSEGKRGKWEIRQIQNVPAPNPLEFGVKESLKGKVDNVEGEMKLANAMEAYQIYQTYQPRIVTIPLTQVDQFSSVRVYLPNNLKKGKWWIARLVRYPCPRR